MVQQACSFGVACKMFLSTLELLRIKKTWRLDDFMSVCMCIMCYVKLISDRHVVRFLGLVVVFLEINIYNI